MLHEDNRHAQKEKWGGKIRFSRGFTTKERSISTGVGPFHASLLDLQFTTAHNSRLQRVKRAALQGKSCRPPLPRTFFSPKTLQLLKRPGHLVVRRPTQGHHGFSSAREQRSTARAPKGVEGADRGYSACKDQPRRRDIIMPQRM